MIESSGISSQIDNKWSRAEADHLREMRQIFVNACNIWIEKERNKKNNNVLLPDNYRVYLFDVKSWEIPSWQSFTISILVIHQLTNEASIARILLKEKHSEREEKNEQQATKTK